MYLDHYPPLKDQVQVIVDRFDFYKAYEVFLALDWTWPNIGIPSVDDLKNTAQSILYEVIAEIQEGSTFAKVATGGLVGEYRNDVLKLIFEVESSMSFLPLGYSEKFKKE